MSTPAHGPATGLDLAALDAITDAVESGAGLPEVVRAAARALDASLVLTDRAGAVLAVAARSPADERSLLDDAPGVEALELRVADATVGTLRMRARSEPGPALVKLVTTLIASEVERLRAPERASEHALTGFVHALLDRDISGREDILGRAGELGIDLVEGASIVVARAHSHVPTEDGWRQRVLGVADRGARAVLPGRRGRAGRARRRGGRGGRGPAPRRRRRERRARGARPSCASCRARFPGTPSRWGAAGPRRTPSICTAPAPRRCWRPTSPRATPSGRCSPSRSRGPIACCSAR